MSRESRTRQRPTDVLFKKAADILGCTAEELERAYDAPRSETTTPSRERALLERIANANVIFPSMCANNGEAFTINMDLEEYRTKPRVERDG